MAAAKPPSAPAREIGMLGGITTREALWLAAGSLLFAAVFCYPILCDWVYLGPGVSDWITTGPRFSSLARYPSNGDWDMFTELRWVPYWTVVHFHQLPFWNPYKCGGMGMLSNPESSIVTPFFLLYLLFGPHAGLYLDIYLHYAIMFAGGYFLGRSLGFGGIASMVSGAVFPASSWLPLHLSVGHLNFLPCAYLPWVAALLIRSIDLRKVWIAVVGGAICALTLTEGNYTFLYCAIIVGSVAVILSVLRLSARPFFCGLLIGVIALGFAALRLLPMSQQLATYPKGRFGLEGVSYKVISVFLFSRYQDLYRGSNGAWEFLFCEYGAYVSPAFALLAVVGIIKRPVAILPWFVPAVIFLSFTRGYVGPDRFSPVVILDHLPLGRNASMTGRYLIPFVFCVGVITAHGADSIWREYGRWGRGLVVALLMFGTVDGWIVGAPNLRYIFHNPLPTLPHSEAFRQFWVPNPGIMTEINEANLGSVNCQGYGYNDIPENAVGYNQPGYLGEQYLRGEGTVKLTVWTPNRLEYDVDTPAPNGLVINQNYFPGWRLISQVGMLAIDTRLVTVELPAGHTHVILKYRPQRLLAAFALTIAATLVVVGLWRLDL